MRLFAGTPYDQPPKCDRCGALEADCSCLPSPAACISPAKQVARLTVEKRRKGKVVTVIRGLSAAGNDLRVLLGRLKSQCGAGGTLQEDRLEIQGEHVERIRALLSALGYGVKG
jgi:translation initiation factor 1